MSSQYREFTFAHWASKGEHIAMIGNNIFDLAHLLNEKNNLGYSEYRKRGDLYWLHEKSDMDRCMTNMMHSHKDFTEIVFIRSGSGITRIENEEYLIKKGDAIIITPGVPHACMPYPQLYITNVLINYDYVHDKSVIYSRDDNILDNSVIIRLRDQALINTDRMFDIMENEYLKKRPGYDEVITTICNGFLMELYRTQSNEAASAEDSKLAKALAYIRENFKTVTLAEAAKVSSYSKPYFSQIFYKHTGEHFTDYINKLKINEVIKLLVTTDMSIESIGESVGFSSKPFMYRMFKKFTGVTPGELRKNSDGEGADKLFSKYFK